MKPVEDDEPITPRPFRLNYPYPYVVRTWLDYRKFGIYPEAGGYNNQDPMLVIHDWGLMNERYSLAYDDLKTGSSKSVDDLIYGNDDDESAVMVRR